MHCFCIITRFWCGRKERSDGIARNERPGIAPLAARPTPTLLTSSFANGSTIVQASLGKAFCSRKMAPTLNSCRGKRKTKIGCPMDILFLWCGRQELKTCDDMKKALIFKAFLLLDANVDAKNFSNI